MIGNKNNPFNNEGLLTTDEIKFQRNYNINGWRGSKMIKLKVAIDVIWFLVILGFIIVSAYAHSWNIIFSLVLFLVHCLHLIREYSNLTVVNKIYNINKTDIEDSVKE